LGNNEGRGRPMGSYGSRGSKRWVGIVVLEVTTERREVTESAAMIEDLDHNKTSEYNIAFHY
jgi:hypothetical protein